MNNESYNRFSKSRKYKGILVVLVLICLVLLISPFLPIDLLGQCRTLDLARTRKDSFYENTRLICTQDSADRYIDFLVHDEEDYFLIIPIKKIDTFTGEKYKVALTTKTFNLSEEIIRDTANYENGKNSWYKVREWESIFLMKESSLTERILYRHLPATCVIDDPDAIAYPFEYRNKQYILYVKVEPIDKQ